MTYYRRDSADFNQNLIAKFDFEENTGTTIRDLINFKDGTLNKNVLNAKGDKLVTYGSSLDLDGSTKVDLTNTIDELGNTFSVSFWMNVDTSDTNFRNILVGGWQAPGAFVCFYYDGALSFQCRDSDNTLISVSKAISTSTTRNIVITADGTRLRMYVDGALESTSGSYAGKNICYLTSPIDIGGTTNDFDGRIDRLRIYNQTLSQQTINKINRLKQ